MEASYRSCTDFLRENNQAIEEVEEHNGKPGKDGGFSPPRGDGGVGWLAWWDGGEMLETKGCLMIFGFWIFMGFYDFLWIFMDVHGFSESEDAVFCVFSLSEWEPIGGF